VAVASEEKAEALKPSRQSPMFHHCAVHEKRKRRIKKWRQNSGQFPGQRNIVLKRTELGECERIRINSVAVQFSSSKPENDFKIDKKYVFRSFKNEMRFHRSKFTLTLALFWQSNHIQISPRAFALHLHNVSSKKYLPRAAL
jgi:hypothetical protein